MDHQIERAYAQWQAFLDSKPGSLDASRRAITEMHQTMPPPDDASITPIDLDGAGALQITPFDRRTDLAIVHVHGGGLKVGSARNYAELGCRIANATGAVVYVLDYPLIPENPAPAQRDATVSALRALTRSSHDAVAITADSAGATAALCAVALLRDARETLPLGVVTFSAMTDLAVESPSYAENEPTDPLCTPAAGIRTAAQILGDRDARDPAFSPLHADLTDFPPVLMFASQVECLRDDSTRFAEAVRAAGGRAEVELSPDAPHIWPIFGYLDQSVAAIERTATFLEECTRTGAAHV